MGLSNIGSIVHQCWAEIPCHYPHVTLDAFIVMPDHVYGILVVGMGGEGETFASNGCCVISANTSLITRQIGAQKDHLPLGDIDKVMIIV